MATDHDKWIYEDSVSRGSLTRQLASYDKFITLRTPHNAQPYLKSTFEEVWNYAEKDLREMSKNKFRSPQDLTQELFRTWQICQSNFLPYNTYQDTKMFPLVFRAPKAIQAIREQTYSLVCINDSEYIRDFETVMQGLHESFNHILPEKSEFEL